MDEIWCDICNDLGTEGARSAGVVVCADCVELAEADA